MSDLKRNLQEKIESFLKIFPVVMLVGVRQSGKTTLAKLIRPEWRYFDLENRNDYDLITRDYGFFLAEHPTNIIIDEAQEAPVLFKHLRGVVDADRHKRGRFILTGSSSPELMKAASDSLAGRIASVEIGPFKMNEIRQTELSPFYQIFQKRFDNESLSFLKTLDAKEKKFDTLPFFLKGGYPEPVLMPNTKAYSSWMEQYFRFYIERDIKKLFPKLDSVRFRRFISMLSELSGTIINRAEVGRSLDISEVTVRDYLDIADKTFIWRMIPSYEKSQSKSLVKMPKGILRDTGLQHYLLRIESREQLIRSPYVGRSFESFVIEELIKGLHATDVNNWEYFYYRTKNGAEIDLILEGPFGVLPIEIKFGVRIERKHLLWLEGFMKRENLVLGLIINNSDKIEMLRPGILQIPAYLI